VKILEGKGWYKSSRYVRLEYITTIWYVLWPFGNLLAIWYIFPRFGILCQYKSCNPALGYYIGRGSGQDSDKLLPEHSQFGNKMCNKVLKSFFSSKEEKHLRRVQEESRIKVRFFKWQ
jgi:hypothetical protein